MGQKAIFKTYMGQMYTLDAFTTSCPANQDILSHYKMQQGAKMYRQEELETPTYTGGDYRRESQEEIGETETKFSSWSRQTMAKSSQ